MGDPPMQTATLSSGFVAEAADRQEKRRRAISGAVFSEFIDMFDIYLPTVVLSPVLFYFQPARLDPGEQAIFASLVFITTLLGRPIGALAFGVVADRLGRRMASITSVAGFGIITFLIALIPGYHQIGIASLLAFGDPALSRRHLPWRRLYRSSSPGDRIFQERTARLHRRPHPLRFSRRLHRHHARRDADVRHLPLSGRGVGLRAMGLAHSLRDWCAARRPSRALLRFHGLGIRDLGDGRRAQTREDAAQRSHLGPQRAQFAAGAGHD